MFSIFRKILIGTHFHLTFIQKIKYSKNEFPLLFIHLLYNCRALLIFIQSAYVSFLSKSIMYKKRKINNGSTMRRYALHHFCTLKQIFFLLLCRESFVMNVQFVSNFFLLNSIVVFADVHAMHALLKFQAVNFRLCKNRKRKEGRLILRKKERK